VWHAAVPLFRESPWWRVVELLRASAVTSGPCLPNRWLGVYRLLSCPALACFRRAASSTPDYPCNGAQDNRGWTGCSLFTKHASRVVAHYFDHPLTTTAAATTHQLRTTQCRCSAQPLVFWTCMGRSWEGHAHRVCAHIQEGTASLSVARNTHPQHSQRACECVPGGIVVLPNRLSGLGAVKSAVVVGTGLGR
jgi:hypothetical protein